MKEKSYSFTINFMTKTIIVKNYICEYFFWLMSLLMGKKEKENS